MIKNVGSSASGFIYTWTQNNNDYSHCGPSLGPVLWDSTRNVAGVEDGTLHEVGSTLYVDLSPNATRAIEWALEKIAAENKFLEALDDNPVLRDAYEKFQLLYILTKEK